MYRIERSIVIPTTLDKAWDFFSDPRNLASITPPEMKFQIKTALTSGEFYPGMTIEYVVRPIAEIPMRWVSEIQEIEERKRFRDVQLIGPYRSWSHLHEFKQVDHGVEMKDVVDYALPYGWLGRLMHVLFIRRKLKHIFDYRTQMIRFLFGKRPDVGTPVLASSNVF